MRYGIDFGIAFLILVGVTQGHAQNVPVFSPNLGTTNLHQVVQMAQKPAIITQEPQAHKTWWKKFMTDPNATFAGAVAVFTLGLVIVGYLQVTQIRKTLDATLKMARATEVSAEATKFAAEATYAIERPLIIAREATMVVSPSERSETSDLKMRMGPFAQIHVKNTGRTPAKLQSLSVRTRVLRDLPDLPDLPPPSPFHPGQVLENGESEYISQKCSYVPGEDIEVLNGRMFWWAYGYIVYTDFADREHRTGFCYRWTPPGPSYPNGKWLYVNSPGYVYLT